MLFSVIYQLNQLTNFFFLFLSVQSRQLADDEIDGQL